ncbi:uncharacterized [Tachysurus ichikawai]
MTDIWQTTALSSKLFIFIILHADAVTYKTPCRVLEKFNTELSRTAEKETHLSRRRKPLGFPSGRLASLDRHRAISITDELWAKASV